MAQDHDRFARLAVGHVLGGLPAADAAAFRSHVLTCRGCRARVAELRDLAVDLEAAEREERARVALRTAAPAQVQDPDPDPPGARITVRHVTVAVVLVIVFSLATAFWNLHLRITAESYASALDAQQEVLAGLASGVPIDAEFAEGVRGLLATDGEQVHASLSGLPILEEDERYVAWLADDGASGPDGGAEARLIAGPSGVADGTLVLTLQTEGAQRLLLTREHAASVASPSDDVLVSARLRAGG